MTNEDRAKAALEEVTGLGASLGLTDLGIELRDGLTWALDEIAQLREDMADRERTIEGYSVLVGETTREIDQLMWELELDREARL